MSELLYSPRAVFLPEPVDPALAEAIRAAGHTVLSGSVGAFERADTVVVTAPPSTSGFFYAGAAAGRRCLLVLLREPGAEDCGVAEVAHDIVRSVDELVDLLRRWDPVARMFVPPTRPPQRYRHRETGEVRERTRSAIGGSLVLRVPVGAPFKFDVILRDGEHEASGWELLEEGSGQ